MFWWRKLEVFQTARDPRKTLKRGKNEKRKVQEKFNNVTMPIKFFKVYFLYMEKGIYFARNASLGKCGLYHHIYSKVFFSSPAGHLKRSNETQTSIEICIGLADVILWYDWIIWGCFCIGFIDFMLKSKSLLEYGNLL